MGVAGCDELMAMDDLSGYSLLDSFPVFLVKVNGSVSGSGFRKCNNA